MKIKFFTQAKIGLAVGLFLAVMVSSCKSFLDVELPKSQLVKVTVFDNYSTASSALTDIYTKIRDRGVLNGTNGATRTLGSYTDELLSFGSTVNPILDFYNNSLLPTNTTVTDYWNNAYNQIYGANSILEGVESSSALTIENKAQLRGEALFIRALVHFYLVNLYGDVPYVTQTDYINNRAVARMPISMVYGLIISDLKSAAELLPDGYLLTDRTRPNKAAAVALLSRAYLYGKFWSDAESSSTTLINRSEIRLEDNVNNVFLLTSRETIWQFQSASVGRNTNEGSSFIFTTISSIGVALNMDLVNSFSSTDLRRANWIKSVSNATSTFYHVYKYKERLATAASKEYSIVFRLAEQYLIRAEARAQRDDLEGAKQDLNKIRFRAGLEPTSAKTKVELLEAILQERRKELFCEHGHRFFDLKRFNQLDQVLSVVKPGWDSTDSLFPIPQNEMSTNINLRPQNPGY